MHDHHPEVTDTETRYDLEERLLEYSARIIRLTEKLPHSRAGRHVSGQLLRSGRAPMAHHGEAQGAESRKDFIHKIRLGLKELRESMRWLKLVQRVPLINRQELLEPLIAETDALTRIFVSSIRTAASNLSNISE